MPDGSTPRNPDGGVRDAGSPRDAGGTSPGGVPEMPDAGQPVKGAKEPCPLADLGVRVVDRTTGSPIENATVAVATLGTRSTGADGWARWERINPGTYDVSARKEGYGPDPGQLVGVNAPAGRTTTTELRLNTPPCTRATITRPGGDYSSSSNPTTAWSTTPCHHFDFQGVVSGSPGSYVLVIHGQVAPSPPYACKWRLAAAVGTLTDDTSRAPTHSAPAAAGQGVLTLQGFIDGTSASCTAQTTVRIYRDHLERDRHNFGTGTSCEGTWSFTRFGTTISISTTWNCFGSVEHAYNGSGTGYVDTVNTPNGWSKAIYDAPISTSQWSSIHSALRRGDVVSFWSESALSGYSAQHAHTCISGTTMYGANNEPVIRSSGHPATWRWFETTSQDYFNNVNSATRTLNFLTRVIVHRKP